MSDHTNDNEKFLSRWSRLKRDTEVAGPAVDPQAAQSDLSSTAALLQQQEKDARAESAPPPLPPVDGLTMDSDFTGFLHPKVDANVQHAAMKKLFSDPHFNVMDGLDTYIDDYSISDPLPVEMLAQMRSAQKIFKWARNELEEGETAPAQLDSAPTTPALDEVAAVSEAVQPVDPAIDVPQPQAVNANTPDSSEKL